MEAAREGADVAVADILEQETQRETIQKRMLIFSRWYALGAETKLAAKPAPVFEWSPCSHL